MKTILNFISIIVFLTLASEAAAVQCGTANKQVVDGNGIGNQKLTALLLGNFVCAVRPPDTWHECHGDLMGGACTPSGNLWDQKLGSDPIDPSQQVGMWMITGGGTTVTYVYGADSYTYEVWQHPNNPNLVDFCGTAPSGNNVVDAIIQVASC